MICTRIKELVPDSDDHELIFNCGVYKIYHIQNPNNFYIGSASVSNNRKHKRGFYLRWEQHLSEFNKGKHHSKYLQNVVNKYGILGIRFSVLEVCEPKDCVKMEQLYLTSMTPSYNTCKIAGSTLGYKHTPETLIKMRNKKDKKKRPPMTEETKLLMSHLAKQRDNTHLWTAESNEKKSKALKGRKLPDSIYEALRKTINQFTLDGIFIKTFNSIEEAALNVKVDRASISNNAMNKRPSAGGFLWSFDNTVKLPSKRVISQYTLNDELLRTFNNLKEIKAFLNITSSNAINNCFIGKQKQAYGYKWKDNYIN